ncbi:glycine zipper family protein [Mesobacillus maritimus]|nr:glycine zipper family protein [Mesobacillus maritimus]MCM3671995.1 glycine zipper family protein [Mesobacillus maritimus]
MSIGMGLGMVFGSLALDNLALGMIFGISIGVGIGSMLDRNAKKNDLVI